MDIENTSATVCSECSTISTLVRLVDVLMKMNVDFEIQHAA
ncbi:hypothetical protein [Mycobacteroides abscessus]|nr:hypothetical protein [Mycobacteroides abscessus]MDQ8118565.1 hypothetical protein [Mycobacteroides abscessus subsp. massiliense]